MQKAKIQRQDHLTQIRAGFRAILTLITERLIPGKWYIIAGGVGGALVAALTTSKEKKNG